MTEPENNKPEETAETKDVVWDLVPDDSELAAFKKVWRTRLIIHLCCAFFAALLLGIVAYSGVFDPPSGKLKPEFVKEAPVQTPEKDPAAGLDRIRKAMAETTDRTALKTLQEELARLLKDVLKDDPDALKLHFELTEKIRAAEMKK